MATRDIGRWAVTGVTPGDLARVADIRARADAATDGRQLSAWESTARSVTRYRGAPSFDDCRRALDLAEFAVPVLVASAHAARSDVPWLLDRLAAETERADKAEAAAWDAAREAVARQTDLTELVHFDRPSDFRKGVLTSLVALDEARKEATG